MNNTRFATALHILTLLAHKPEEWLSSDYIAGSICINPVMVRKELAVLNEAGLVVSRKGKEGGSRLSRPDGEISLTAIYLAVKNSEVLGKKNRNTNPLCPVGRQINARLNDLYADTDRLITAYLERRTLNDFAGQFS